MSSAYFGKNHRQIMQIKALQAKRGLESAGMAKTCHCGSPMILRKSEKGTKYWVCKTHRSHMVGYVNYDEPTKTCPNCYHPMSLRQGRYGSYWSCSNFTECRHTESANVEAKGDSHVS